MHRPKECLFNNSNTRQNRINSSQRLGSPNSRQWQALRLKEHPPFHPTRKKKNIYGKSGHPNLSQRSNYPILHLKKIITYSLTAMILNVQLFVSPQEKKAPTGTFRGDYVEHHSRSIFPKQKMTTRKFSTIR